jgi:hypothetical protein
VSRRRRSRVPGTRVSTLFVLPSIPDDAPEALKDGLAIRNACAVEGRCPVCGVEPDLVADRKLAGVWHLVFRHEDECPGLRDPEAA